MNEQSLHTQKFKAQLDEWKADIDKLKARATGASIDVQLDVQKKVDTLDAKMADAHAKLDQLSAAGADAWDDLKANVEQTWAGLKTSMQDALEKLKA
ncbi:MAG: coiled coil domain-containing protein [Pseudomonadota bacterium]